MSYFKMTFEIEKGKKMLRSTYLLFIQKKGALAVAPHEGSQLGYQFKFDVLLFILSF